MKKKIFFLITISQILPINQSGPREKSMRIIDPEIILGLWPELLARAGGSFYAVLCWEGVPDRAARVLSVIRGVRLSGTGACTHKPYVPAWKGRRKRGSQSQSRG